MKINLYLIEAYLQELEINRHIMYAPYELTLDSFHCWTCNEISYRKETLYIIGEDDLKRLSAEEMEKKEVSLLILGTASNEWVKSSVSYLALSGGVALPAVVNMVEQAFQAYLQWTERLQQCVDQGKSLREMAYASEKLIHNCIYLQGAFFQALLVYTPSDCGESPEIRNYLAINTEKDGGFIAAEEIYELISDENYNNAILARYPTMFDGLYSYRSLYYNLRSDGMFVARLLIDEVVEKITDKDYALILILGHYIEKSLAKSGKPEFTRLAGIDEMMQDLLHHVLLPEQNIVGLLEKLGWGIRDRYICLLLRSKVQGDSASILPPLAADLSTILRSYCYTSIDDHIVFICNLSSAQKDASEWIAAVTPELRNRLVSVYISSCFNDFKNLFYYYSMTKVLETVGNRKDPEKWVYRFQDYYTDCLLQVSLMRTVPEVLIPDPLKAVMDYDRQKGTDLTNSLRVYLDNERNMALTARKLYIHRNTCMQRIAHIEKILGISLDDPNNRLMLQLAFQIMDQYYA